jgi:F-type H+-transporting ATPase subunit alpha
MKKVAGTLKLDQAQYRELEAFAKFGSDLDPSTKAILEKGQRNVELLKQNEKSPMSVEEQVAVIYCGTKGLLREVPIGKVRDFEEDFLNTMRSHHSDVLEEFKQGKLSDEALQTVEKTAKELAANYKEGS